MFVRIFTAAAVYTKWEQHRLPRQYDDVLRSWHPPRQPVERAGGAAAGPTDTARDAAAYRRETCAGEAIGRIRIPRLDLNMVLVLRRFPAPRFTRMWRST